MKTIVIGLGNTIRADDGVGIYAVRRLVPEFENNPNVDITEASWGGLRLLELMSGHDRAIIVDAIQTGNGKPGEIYKLAPEDFPKNARFISVHDISFLDSLKFGDKIGMKVPTEIIIYAVEAKDVVSFAEECTPEIEAALPKLVEEIRSVIGNQ